MMFFGRFGGNFVRRKSHHVMVIPVLPASLCYSATCLKMAFLEPPQNCTVSGSKRQFDEWHLFHSYTCHRARDRPFNCRKCLEVQRFCAMTTQVLDNKSCTFKFLLSWCLPRKKKKQCFWTIFLSAPNPPSPQKKQI